MSAGRWRPRAAVAVRFAVSATLLVAIARLVDLGDVLARLRDLRLPWVLAGVALSCAQLPVLAWRWRFTAARLGLELPYRRALAEYWLGVLLNQVLPGGIPGDVARAWRHARGSPRVGTAVRGVVLERASAQAVMTTVAVVSALSLPLALPRARLALGAALVALGAATIAWAARARVGRGALSRLRGDAHRALMAWDAWPAQLASGLVVVASYVAVYLIAARAVGVDTEIARLLPLVAPVLMTMLIPVTVAGWGIREGAAGALWALVGLTPEDGVAISVAYGLLALVASVPGALALTGRSADPDRRERPGRARIAEPGA